MSITVCGINHKTAPVEIREKAVFAQEKLSLYLADLLAHENIQEAVILSTCNRSELYCHTDDKEKMLNWFCSQHHLDPEELQAMIYIYQDQQAIEHIMQVACGIDSMILGESQILGQMKDAFSESCAAGLVGPTFNRLFQQVFAVAKEIRTNTAIGGCPVSVASAAVSLAKQVAGDLSAAKMVVLGAGATVDLVLRYLHAQPVKQIQIINRSHDNALQLAAKYGIEAVSFIHLPTVLADADIVITATGSISPIINKTLIQNAVSQRLDRPLTIVDIAVPRDVDAAVKEVDVVQLYCIDDLKTIIQHNLQGREHAAEKAREVIRQKSQEFLAWLNSADAVSTTIRAYRSQIEAICAAELTKAKKLLERGEDPKEVLAQFSNAFMNKLLHAPSVQLRQAGSEGRFDLLQLAQQLFAVPQLEAELV